nr:unnamed protein product [Callosobruchus analis]
MNNPQCTLCSSTNSLLSIFSGKNKLYRNYIKSLTTYTVGIKFEKHDVRQYICLTCVVQVYNFYVFKIHSLENEKGLRDTLCENLEEITEEDKNDIELPIIDELKQAFLPWLLSKHSSETEQDENNSKLTFVQTDLCLLNMIDMYSQCDIQTAHSKTETADKGTQTSFDFPQKKIDISCQTDVPILISQENFGNAKVIIKTNNIFSQTDWVQCKTTAVQTISRGRKRKKFITDSPEQRNQSNGDLLIKRRKLNKKNGLKEYPLGDVVELMDVPNVHFVEDSKKQSDVLDIDVATRVIQEKRKLSQENQPVKHGVIRLDNVDQKTNTKKMMSNAEVKIIIERNIFSPVSNTVCADLSSEKQLLQKPAQFTRDEERLNPKEPIQNAEVTNTSNFDKTTTVSQTFCNDQHSQVYLSPRSSGLLSVQDKVEYVKICKYCDLTLYSQREMINHRRKHLKCRYCMLQFTSLKKLRVHIISQCKKRLILTVHLVPLEQIYDIKEKYPFIEEVLGGERKRSDSFA